MGMSKLKIGRAKLEVMHPDSAGIDVGGSRQHVAVRSDATEQPVKDFGCYTRDLHAMADWLHECGVKIVALESTGVYWIPLYEVLERRGLELRELNRLRTRLLREQGRSVQHMQKALTLMNVQLPTPSATWRA